MSQREPYRVLSLFAGIGGFDLGLERTGGFRTVAFCEIDPFCRRVLAKHWPLVPCYHDVRELSAERLASDGIEVDCIVGGFPCQDISFAGKGAGIGGERSGLWSEYARLVRELRPRFVVVENVRALLVRGLDSVLGALAALGYDAEWHCIPAAAVGAPHRRDRLWIVAYAGGQQHEGGCAEISGQIASQLSGTVTDAHEQRAQISPEREFAAVEGAWSDGGHGAVASAHGLARDERGSGDASEGQGRRNAGRGGLGANVADPEGPAIRPGLRSDEPGEERRGRSTDSRSPRDWWASEPDVGRVAHGVPSRVDRLRSLGNAVVPQIPEMIGRAILAADQPMREAA